MSSDPYEQFAMLAESVSQYNRSWWTRPGPHHDVLARRPKLRAQLVRDLRDGVAMIPTTRLWAADGAWEPERVDEHTRVLAALAPAGPTPLAPGAPVYFTLGLPGSGKTSGLRPIVAAHAGAKPPASSADDIREQLPEYADGLGSVVLQLEAVAVCYAEDGYPPGGGLQDRVIAAGPAIVDTLGGPWLADVVQRLADDGRRVFALLTECPIDVCVDRVIRRALRDDRYVPLDVVRDAAARDAPTVALDAARATGALDGWAVVDTAASPPCLLDGDGTFDDVVPAAAGGAA